MNRYWIFDEDGSAQRFPLAKLVARLGELVDRESAQIVLTRSQGYGEHICGWDDLLDCVEALPIPFAALAQVVHQTDELFYNLDAVCSMAHGTVRFGLHDSSALFVDAPDELAERLTAGWSSVRTEPAPDQRVR